MQKKKLWIVLTSIALVAGAGTGIFYSQQAKAQEESRVEAQKEKEAADLLQKQTVEKETTAKNAVAALYLDDKKVLLADDFTPAKATAAKQLADALDNKDLKGALVGDIAKANVLYASIEGTQKATQALFQDANQKVLATGVDAAKLTAVKKAIDSVPQNLAKANLNKGWIIASNLLKADIAAKQKAEADRVAKEQAVVATNETKEAPQSSVQESSGQSNNEVASNEVSRGSKNNNKSNYSKSSSSYQAPSGDNNNSSTPASGSSKSTASSSSKSSGSSSYSDKSSSESNNNESSNVKEAPKQEPADGGSKGTVNKEVPNPHSGGTTILSGW
ncbi:hypothetical protein [Listeria newyorkensis]|uniref:hypothetical protein n=1 Tax=Listeria newyorkensis TaxID=1497681 RepID=UPI00051D6038|nr:hypothetical protein [Listeria newyorkensis]KGL43641.1 hypothetical protein EP58_07850 [Listeria newyorkensis]